MSHDPFDTLAQYAIDTKSADLADTTLNASQTLLTDTVACILAGTSAQGIPELLRATARYGGSGNARVVGITNTSSPEDAAFLNAVLCHARDYDDTHDEAVNHGCVTVVPALLALCDLIGESQVVSGKEFITAMAIGLDIANRIGLSVTKHLHTGWLPTTLWGPIGAAAACGRILGLDSEAMQHAFGFGYAQAHGNRQALVEGTLAKRIQPGFAAAAGLRAAIMASEGLTAACRIGTGVYGIREMFTGGRSSTDEDDSCFIDALVGDLGVRNETDNISIKPYPCCRCTHPVIDAALEIHHRNEIHELDEIDSVIVRLPPHSYGQIGQPFTVRSNPTVDAQFSAAYTASIGLTGRRPKISDFRADSIIGRSDLLSITPKMHCEQFSPESAGVTPVEVEVHTHNGRKCFERVEHASGSPKRRLSNQDILDKFLDCANNATIEFGAQNLDDVLSTLSQISDVKDMRLLLSSLTPR